MQWMGRSGFKPFMEYAGSYALFNWKLADSELGMQYDNMRLIRAFEHGLDSHSSEAGFVLVHVEMVKHSSALVSGSVDALGACGLDDREEFDEGLGEVVRAMKRVNEVMDSKSSSFDWLKMIKGELMTGMSKACGRKVSRVTTTNSVPSSSASRSRACSRMGSCMKGSARSQCHSEERAGQTIV